MYQIVNYYQENIREIEEFKLASRTLWNDHISYTRNAIVSILSGLPDVAAISARLIKNQEDIGTFLTPYYPVDQVATLVDLLKQHITIAVDVVNAVEGAESLWRANGNSIVAHLQMMNPMFWPASLMGPLWTAHLDMTIAQVNARKSQAWTDDIDAYDMNHQHMNRFSDLFAFGVIYQNMYKFCLIG